MHITPRLSSAYYRHHLLRHRPPLRLPPACRMGDGHLPRRP